MNRLLRIGILAVVTLSLTVYHGRTGHAQSQGSREDVEAIKQVVMQMTAGMNTGDAKTIAAVYTPDADLVTVFGQRLRGAAEIEKVMGAFFHSSLKTVDVKTLDISIRFIRPDVAFAHVTNELSGTIDAQGQPQPPVRELSIRVCVKENGRWRVAAFHNTIVRPSGHR
jgi:uncharacterized protein (TIGR02246 family)